MTEYDYSPEAFDRYVRKQQTISKWVQKTSKGPMRDPFTPATPAALANDLDASDQDDITERRRGQSYDQYDHHRDRDRDRHRDGDRGDRHKDKPRSLHHSSRPPNTRRSRSSSQSAVPIPYNAPPPLLIPSHPWQMPYSQKPSPVPLAPYQYYPPKLTSPRDSRRSSHSSSTARMHSPNFLPQTSPYGSPVNYGHSPDANHGYSKPSRDGRFHDFANAPQLPYSAYQVKQPPNIFKRLFKGLTGSNKHQVPQRGPRRKRSSSF
ncbi:hypothetical protein BYT27DRAFT_7259972 [Phlegmacium glaucopus]|nr:hypothetical protein BYT27DRAFT_7259972 [Phlegmacium glaucopus]